LIGFCRLVEVFIDLDDLFLAAVEPPLAVVAPPHRRVAAAAAADPLRAFPAGTAARTRVPAN
jgi:hypothetical protein